VIYIAEPGSFLLKRLSSMVVETIIFRSEDSMLPCLEEILNIRSENEIRWFQLSGRRIVIDLAQSGMYLLERLSSTLREITTSRPED